MKEIANAPFSTEEKQALEALVKKSVVKLLQEKLPVVEKGLATLDEQIQGYQKVNRTIIYQINKLAKTGISEDEKSVMSQRVREGGAALLADIKEGRLLSLSDINQKIAALNRSLSEPESALSLSRPQVSPFLRELTEDKSLGPEAETLTQLHTTPSLDFIRRVRLRPESRLLMSKLVRDQVVNLRTQYRQGRIDLQGYEAGLKEIRSNLINLHKQMKELETLEDELVRSIKSITVSPRLRENLALRIDHELQEIKKRHGVETLLEAIKGQKELVLKVVEYLSTREQEFEEFELPLSELIDSGKLSQADKDELLTLYDECLVDLIDDITKDQVNSESLYAIELTMSGKINTLRKIE